MSTQTKSMFIFRLFWTLFSISIIPRINGHSLQPHQSFNREHFESEPDPACVETPDSGSGKQLLHVWYFSVETAQCRQLIYRGYGGSGNKFRSRRECEGRCLRHYTEGAEQFGPKLKATVEHLTDKSKLKERVFTHRTTPFDFKQSGQRNGRNSRNGRKRKSLKDDRESDYYYGGFITKDKPAPHPRSLTAYDDQDEEE